MGISVAMAIPEVLDNPTPADYLALISRAIFQAGVSWKLIDSKWDGYNRLFEGFDPMLVARFGESDVDRIAQDPSIVRTRKKVQATVENARVMLEIEREFGSFAKYLKSFDSYKALSTDMRKRFKFLGELSAYYVLFRVREPVPRFEDWLATIEGEHPRMREMVDVAREQGRSSELV